MHISLALGVEAAQGEISSWICSCAKSCRGFEFTQSSSSQTPFQWGDVSVCWTLLLLYWSLSSAERRPRRVSKLQGCESSDLTSYHFRVWYYYPLLYGKSVCVMLSFLVVLYWECFIPNAQCLLLGSHNCVGPNAAGLSGQKCYTVFIAEAGALLYFAILRP